MKHHLLLTAALASVALGFTSGPSSVEAPPESASPGMAAGLSVEALDVPRFVITTTSTTTSTTTTTTAPPPTTTTTRPPAPPPAPARVGACAGWGDLVASYFPSEASIACAVLVCESQGNPNAVSPTNDHGLMQINAMWNDPDHADPVAQWIGARWGSRYDPGTNLGMAVKIRNAYGWDSWSCYR